MVNISYNQFCIKVYDEVKKLCGEEVNVQLQNVQKLNGVILQGITISNPNGNIMPTLYLDKFYKEYEDGTAIEEIVSLFLEEYEKARVRDSFDIQFFCEYEKVKSHLGFKLMHYEMNKELLEQVAHKRFLDLAIVGFCDIRDKQIGHGAITIRNEHLEMWKISKEELFREALENMPRLYPADFMNMKTLLKEVYYDPIDLLSVSIPMYVLTNSERLNGAASLLYEGKMEELAAILGGDYYVLPSSIHEVIIMPKDTKRTEETYLSRMVDEINHEQLGREEILSNHAYVYCSKTKQLQELPVVPYRKMNS